MDRESVLNVVARYLEREMGIVWMHPRDSSRLGQLEFPLHHVHIGGYFPDLLALRDADRVVAVAVCGSQDDHLAGLGRGVRFRPGAHYAVLAGELGAMREHRTAALDSGLGVLTASGDGRVDLTLPAPTPLPLDNDVRRELAILSRRNVRRRISSLGFDHPLHFAAPILAIRPDAHPSKQDVASLLMERWGFDGSRTEAWWSCLYGALFLGLVTETDDHLSLTDLGVRMRVALLDRRSASELREMVSHPLPLVDQAPEVALVLRGAFLLEPDVARVVRILEEVEPTGVGVEKVVLRMLQLHPNAGLNLFFKAEHHEEVLGLVRGARYRDLFRPEMARRLLLPGVYSTFKRQLVHLGFLQPSTPTWSSPEGYDPGDDLWLPRR